jgi:hypothetical protein
MTAVEWLVEEIKKCDKRNLLGTSYCKNKINEALEMEKQQKEISDDEIEEYNLKNQMDKFCSCKMSIGRIICCMNCKKPYLYPKGKSPYDEISDEEIEKWVASTPYYGHCTTEYREGLDEGAKWYREQLKQRK